MRRFELQRDVDETGVSGTGVVAQGIEFDDWSVAMRWLSVYTSTAVYENMQDVIAIHCHQGESRVVYLDEAS